MIVTFEIPTEKETIVNEAFTGVFDLGDLTGQEKYNFMISFLKGNIRRIVRRHQVNQINPVIFE